MPWFALFDAYGSAWRLKRFLLDLHVGDADEKDEAIYDGLWSRAIHQYSWNTSTLFCVRPVVMALQNGIRHEPGELLGFLCQCVKIGTYKLRWRFWIFPVSPVRLLQLPFLMRVGLPTLEKEIPKGKAVYEELLHSSDPRIQEHAKFLLDFCRRC